MRVWRAVLGCAVLAYCGGCAAPPKSSTLTMGDYVFIASEISEKLHAQLASGFMADRCAESPPIVLTFRKVLNLTSDVMPEGAKWYLIAHVRGKLPLQTLASERNVRFVMPAESLREARRRGTIPEDEMTDRAPTHLLDATFRSATRSTGVDRTDSYYCEYQITDIKSGELIWTDKVEFKRPAEGLSWD